MSTLLDSDTVVSLAFPGVNLRITTPSGIMEGMAMFTTVPEMWCESSEVTQAISASVNPDPQAPVDPLQVKGTAFSLSMDMQSGITWGHFVKAYITWGHSGADGTWIPTILSVFEGGMSFQVSPRMARGTGTLGSEQPSTGPITMGIANRNYVADGNRNVVADGDVDALKSREYVDPETGCMVFASAWRISPLWPQTARYMDPENPFQPFKKSPYSMYAIRGESYIPSTAANVWKNGRVDTVAPDGTMSAAAAAYAGLHGYAVRANSFSGGLYAMTLDLTSANTSTFANVPCLTSSVGIIDLGYSATANISFDFGGWWKWILTYPSPMRMMYYTGGRQGMFAIQRGPFPLAKWYGYTGREPYHLNAWTTEYTEGMGESSLWHLATYVTTYPMEFMLTNYNMSMNSTTMKSQHSGTQPSFQFEIFQNQSRISELGGYLQGQPVTFQPEPVSIGTVDATQGIETDLSSGFREINFFPLRNNHYFINVPNRTGTKNTLFDGKEDTGSFIYWSTCDGPFKPPEQVVDPQSSEPPPPNPPTIVTVAFGSDLEMFDSIVDPDLNPYYTDQADTLFTSFSSFPHVRPEKDMDFFGYSLDVANCQGDNRVPMSSSSDPIPDGFSFYLDSISSTTCIGPLDSQNISSLGVATKPQHYDHVVGYNFLETQLVCNIPLATMAARIMIPGYVHGGQWFKRDYTMSFMTQGNDVRDLMARSGLMGGFTLAGLMIAGNLCMSKAVFHKQYNSGGANLESVSHALTYNFPLTETMIALGSFRSQQYIYYDTKGEQPQPIYSYLGLASSPHYISHIGKTSFIPTDIGILEVVDGIPKREWLHPLLDTGAISSAMPVFSSANMTSVIGTIGASSFGVYELVYETKPKCRDSEWIKANIDLYQTGKVFDRPPPDGVDYPSVRAEDIYSNSIISVLGTCGCVSGGYTVSWTQVHTLLIRD